MKNKQFGGVGLLDPSRTCSISSDVSRHLSSYSNEKKAILSTTIGDSEDKKEKINNAKKTCLQRIDSIIHHHCGNHEHCDHSHCLHKKIELEVRTCVKIMDENKDDAEKRTEKEIKEMIEEKYAKQSRFKGSYMDISLNGQNELKTVIKKRLNEKNLDRIAKILSSNCCEQYFGCLVKYSQGKRLNQDMTDSWRVLQYFVAGLRSNANFTSDLIEHIGLVPSHIRNEMKLKIKKRISMGVS